MIRCTHFEEIVSDYLDNQINPDSRTAVEEHLSGCERCRALVKHISTVRTRLKHMTRLQTAGDFESRLHARIEAELRGAQPAWDRAARRWTLFNVKTAVALAAAACIALAVLAWQNYSQTESFQPAPTAIAPVEPVVPAPQMVRTNPQLKQSTAQLDDNAASESDSIEQDLAQDRNNRHSDLQDHIRVVRQTQ